jgi:hypothetical protein
MIKILGIDGKFLNLIKNIYKKPTASIILHSEKLNAFPLRLGARQRYPHLSPLFNILGEARLINVKQESEMKDIQKK